MCVPHGLKGCPIASLLACVTLCPLPLGPSMPVHSCQHVRVFQTHDTFTCTTFTCGFDISLSCKASSLCHPFPVPAHFLAPWLNAIVAQNADFVTAVVNFTAGTPNTLVSGAYKGETILLVIRWYPNVRKNTLLKTLGLHQTADAKASTTKALQVPDTLIDRLLAARRGRFSQLKLCLAPGQLPATLIILRRSLKPWLLPCRLPHMRKWIAASIGCYLNG